MQGKGPGQEAMETPRAAGLAGVVFALLLSAAIVLIRLGIPEGADTVTPQAFTDSTRQGAVKTALALVPFAGIFFLWFVGAVRAHVGAVEDKFLATVFLGSGLVFTATMFGAAAAAGAVLAVAHPAGTSPGLSTWDFGRHFAYTLLTGYAMRMAAVFVCSMSVIGHRLGVLPRWLSVLGFLTALTLLFVSSNVPWAELVFPAWSLVLSVHIMVAGGRARSRLTASA
ncbi:hypothetical protein [Streptomyces diastatochromogenes]|uniref:DUF4386 domain-containing protein n=1 Tax=Streptomyces diastatochromogenes TaxID=42236 RepID=A0A233S8J1_STRDA|nr:hypothetical protein [Streptomyces diastatochromogenes]MCZ0990501.1 hypothetical protein [Streptomyces diastatochromogenes]OXY91978.1 hypothetical protein BEK98_28275 [Streptomyces diastatochromogenes]